MFSQMEMGPEIKGMGINQGGEMCHTEAATQLHTRNLNTLLQTHTNKENKNKHLQTCAITRCYLKIQPFDSFHSIVPH